MIKIMMYEYVDNGLIKLKNNNLWNIYAEYPRPDMHMYRYTYGADLNPSIRKWLHGFNHSYYFSIGRMIDITDSTHFASRFIGIDFEDPADEMLFKLTWL